MIKKLLYAVVLLPILLIVVVVIASAIGGISRKHRFDDAKTLTRITEVEFPEFKVIEYEKGRTGFHGDYSDELVLEFKEMPSEEFYTILEYLADRGNANIVEKDSVDGNLYFTESYYKQTYWSFTNNSTYYYSRVWGNGLPAPPGEDDEEDMSLSIQIKRGEKCFHVSYGAW